MYTNNAMCVCYARSQLLQSRCNIIVQYLPTSLYRHIRKLAINRTLPTKRGCRAGNVIHRIRPRITQRSEEPVVSSRTVIYHNLTVLTGANIPINRYTRKPERSEQQKPPRILQTISACVKYNISNSLRLKCGLLNARSVCNKATALNEIILDRHIDVLCITETWLRADNSNGNVLSDLVPAEYDIIHHPRVDKRGGGSSCCVSKAIKNCRNP